MRHKSVVDLARELSESEAFANEVAQDIAKRELVKQLIALRSAKGMSQSDIAKQLGCSQSRVSKLEAGADAELRVGDVRDYAKALGLDVSIGLVPRNLSATERIMLHARTIRKLLGQLVERGLDERLATGIAGFVSEPFFNLLGMIKESADRLPDDLEGDDCRLSVEDPAVGQRTSLEPDTIDASLPGLGELPRLVSSR